MTLTRDRILQGVKSEIDRLERRLDVVTRESQERFLLEQLCRLYSLKLTLLLGVKEDIDAKFNQLCDTLSGMGYDPFEAYLWGQRLKDEDSDLRH